MGDESKTRNLLSLATMKIVKYVVFVLLLIVPFWGMSQFSDSLSYYLNVAGTGNLNKTSSGTTFLMNNSVKFQVNKEKLSLNSAVGHVYGRNPNVKTNDDFLTVVNLDYLRDVQKFYYWALASYEKSYSLKVDNRVQAGVGVGYTFVNNSRANLLLSDGFLLETADLAVPDQHGRKSNQTVRNSLRLKYRFLIGQALRVDGTNFYQPSMADAKDYILKLNTNVSVKIFGPLSLAGSFNYNRQNITSTENLLVTYGISYDKYF